MLPWYAPHPRLGDPKTLNNVISILRSCQRNVANHQFIQKDANELEQLSIQFQDINLELPVLSVYEVKETKIKSPGLMRTSKKTIVSEPHAYSL